ncbi:hypothetical protein P5V15_006403 [Pogonomyrmex californicus]
MVDDKFRVIQQHLSAHRCRLRDWLSVDVKLRRDPTFSGQVNSISFPIEMEDETSWKIYGRQSITVRRSRVHSQRSVRFVLQIDRIRLRSEFAGHAPWSAANVILRSPHGTAATFKKYQ